MNLAKILNQLRQELSDLDAAIETLERLQRGDERRRSGSSKTNPGSKRSPEGPAGNAPPSS